MAEKSLKNNIGQIVYHFLLIDLLVKSDKQLYQIVIKLCDQCEMTIAVFPSKVWEFHLRRKLEYRLEYLWISSISIQWVKENKTVTSW